MPVTKGKNCSTRGLKCSLTTFLNLTSERVEVYPHIYVYLWSCICLSDNQKRTKSIRQHPSTCVSSVRISRGVSAGAYAGRVTYCVILIDIAGIVLLYLCKEQVMIKLKKSEDNREGNGTRNECQK